MNFRENLFLSLSYLFYQEVQLVDARETISNLKKELIEEKKNTKQMAEDFLIKEKLLQTKLENANRNEWNLFNTFLEKVKKILYNDYIFYGCYIKMVIIFQSI